MLKLQFKDKTKPAIWLVAPRIKIGHDKSCDIVLNDSEVAGVQVELKTGDRSIAIKVIDDSRPTQINGKPVNGNAKLKVNDIIKLGNTELKIIDPLAEHELGSDETELSDKNKKNDQGEWMLRAISPPFKGQLFPIKDFTTVGRESSSDIPIPLNHVSRKHAELILHYDTLVIRDMNSRNGTYVNGNKITKKKLNPGDDIRIDVIAFKVLGPNDKKINGITEGEATEFRPPQEFIDEKKNNPNLTRQKTAKMPIADGNEPATKKAFLHGLSGLAEGNLVELDKKQNFIGRMIGCHIARDELNVAGRQTEINQEGVHWRLRNHGASNGAYVNGKMTLDAKLLDGDIVKIGNSELYFQCSGDEPVRPTHLDKQAKGGNLGIIIAGSVAILALAGAFLVFYFS